jgi:cation:H+ antiporter
MAEGVVSTVEAETRKRAAGNLVWIAAAVIVPAAWLVARFASLVDAPVPTALLSGVAILGAAFLLSWATEVAQLDIARALALAFLALVAVFPEYAVDVYFAWRAGRDPTYTAYATANMTGANRLLIGVGWAVPVIAYWLRFGRREVSLPREQAVEVNYLALATVYSFIIPVKGTLSLVDTVVLLGVFVAYMRAAGRTHHAEPEIEGPAELIAGLGRTGRRVAVVATFLFAGVVILSAAEPFAESLIATGKGLGIDEFLLVQWVAPLASEAPEFVVAVLFAVKGAAAAAMGTLISSKVNQWTLLIGALPAAFSLSAGDLGTMHLDERQREEILLTSAQSLFALVVIANFRITVTEALMLLVLFIPQFVFTHPEGRLIEAGVYLALSITMVTFSPGVRAGVLSLLPWSRGRA